MTNNFCFTVLSLHKVKTFQTKCDWISKLNFIKKTFNRQQTYPPIHPSCGMMLELSSAMFLSRFWPLFNLEMFGFQGLFKLVELWSNISADGKPDLTVFMSLVSHQTDKNGVFEKQIYV